MIGRAEILQAYPDEGRDSDARDLWYVLEGIDGDALIELAAEWGRAAVMNLPEGVTLTERDLVAKLATALVQGFETGWRLRDMQDVAA